MKAGQFGKSLRVCLKFSFLVSALFLTAEVAAAATIKPSSCGKSSGPTPWKYCLYAGSPKTSNLIYYFHPKGADEHGWETDGQDFVDGWNAQKKPVPAVISISFGEGWTLAEKNSGNNSGYLEIFLQEIMPALEKKINRPIGDRIIFGYSMGGLNALEVALKSPTLFKKAFVGCPAFPDIPPYSGAQEIQAYVAKTGASPDAASFMFQGLAERFPDEKSWDLANPLSLLKAADKSTLPAIFLSTGTEDEYGLYFVSKEIMTVANTAGINIQSSWVSGGHCSIDTPAVIKFLNP